MDLIKQRKPPQNLWQSQEEPHEICWYMGIRQE